MSQLQIIFSDHGYQYIDVIGSGSFASVFLCKSFHYNHQFAIKQILKDKLHQSEVESLISLIHPYIIKLYNTFSEGDYQYLVMEYCQKGTIKQLHKIEFDKFVFYARQILEVLEYCHSQNIAHRDIKPENIFLDQYDHIKLGDFGLSSKFQDQQLSSRKCGSLMYCSPEILTDFEFDPFKADIWALGITFFFMVTGHLPFKYHSNDDLRDIIINNQISFNDDADVDPQIQYLIKKMTTKNPLFRPTAHQLLKFPIFNKSTGKIKKTISMSFSHNSKFQFNSSSTSTFQCEKDCLDVKEEKKVEIPKKIRSFKSQTFNLGHRLSSYSHFVKYD